MRRALRLAVVTAAGLSLTVATAADPPVPAATKPVASTAPWANKFFIPDIATNREQAAPPVIFHDFGEVPHGTLCVHKFTITNIYDVPMQITDVRPGCSCLGYVPMTKVLEPNETAEFTVTMDTGKFAGHSAKNFSVTFGPKFVSTAEIRVSAVSRTDVSVSPGVVGFGTVPQGTRLNQSVQVKYSGRVRDWKITEVVQGEWPFDVKLTETSRGPIRAGAEYQVDVTLSSRAKPGPIAEQITLKTSDNQLIHLSVTGTVVAPLEVNPNKVRFEVKTGESATQRILVRGAKAFKVVGVDGGADGVSVELPANPASLPVQVIVVKFEPKKAGSIARQLRIRTDLPGDVSALLSVEANGTKE